MRKVILVTAAICAFALMVSGAAAKTVNVDISKAGFVPSAVTIDVGDAVTWTNKDTDNHQVVCKDCPFTSPVLKPNETFSFTFAKAGKFTTEDPLNGGKKGTVTVKAAAATLTLSAAPVAATYGNSTTLAGSLSTQQSGQKVSIDAQPCDAHSAKSVANVTTTTGGAFTDQERPTMNTAYQASYKPAGGPAVQSATVSVKVRPKVTLAKIATRKFTVRIYAATSFVGRAIVFQRFNSALAKWISVRSVLLRTAFGSATPLPSTTVSSATFKVKIKRHLRVRAVLPPAQAGTCYLAARSATIRS
jgi:plastocyanin